MRNNEDSFYQRGASDVGGLGALIIFGLIIAGVLWLFGFNYHTTSEGTADYSDCRQVITLQPNDWKTYFGTFVGTTRKTKSGVVMGGEFVRIENDSSLLGSSHTCATAYIYDLAPATNCDNNIKDGVKYPYLGYDDMCYTTPQ